MKKIYILEYETDANRTDAKYRQDYIRSQSLDEAIKQAKRILSDYGLQFIKNIELYEVGKQVAVTEDFRKHKDN